MHQYTFLLSVLLTPFFALRAQSPAASPYHFSINREIAYTAGGLAAKLGADVLRRDIELIPIQDLDLPRLPAIDRLAPAQATPGATRMSDNTRDLAKCLPLVMLAGRRSRRHAPAIGMLYLETMLLNRGLTDFAKAVSLRPRPYVFNGDMPAEALLHGEDRASFFSGHTSVTAAASVFTARVFADFYPDSPLKPYVWGTAVTLPVLTGYFRIRGQKHYPTDVLGGLLVGGAVGYLVPALHKRKIKNPRLRMSTGAGWLGLYYRLE